MFFDLRPKKCCDHTNALAIAGQCLHSTKGGVEKKLCETQPGELTRGDQRDMLYISRHAQQ